jgi:hypothetical protein
MKTALFGKIKSLTFVMLLLLAVSVAPAIAADAATCSATRQNLNKTDLTGIEKNAAISVALNNKDVGILSDNLKSADLQNIYDNARASSMEKRGTDGSVIYLTSVVLPTGVVSQKDGFVEISNVVALWDDKTSKVMRYTLHYEGKILRDMTFSRVGDKGEILSSVVYQDGKFVSERTGGFYSTDSLESYWGCVSYCIGTGCICGLTGVPCPPGTAPGCGICYSLCSGCVASGGIIVELCYLCGLCLGVDLGYCMGYCWGQ